MLDRQTLQSHTYDSLQIYEKNGMQLPTMVPRSFMPGDSHQTG